MHAEVTVALSQEDDRLEIPWQSDDGALQYFDLRRHPESIFSVEEANGEPALLDLLLYLNGERSILQSAKCDTWLSNEMDVEDEFFGAIWKRGSYVDVVLADAEKQADQQFHLFFAEALTGLLKGAPEIPAAAELVLRACHFHEDQVDGFALTIYLLGYGDDPDEAQQRWVIGLQLIQAALEQLSVA